MSEKYIIVLYLLLFTGCFVSSKSCKRDRPRQVHLSFGESSQEIIVTWITFEDSQSWVQYGTQKFTNWQRGSTEEFVDEGDERKVRYIHRVCLSRLLPDTVYKYRCGDKFLWSDEFAFETVPLTSCWSPRVIIYGDMGVDGAETWPFIRSDVHRCPTHAIIHVGDLGYNLEDENGDVGDAFFDMIEPVASQVPYMTVPGNHEQSCNFSHYKHRLSMPGDADNLYYSFNLGPAHFVGISTEVYFFAKYGYHPLQNQFKWLKKDLREAASPKNRRRRPWIILYGHRPMYCSCPKSKEDCLRYGMPFLSWHTLEELLHENGVDLAFWGHLHFYERTFPVYNDKVFNGTCQNPYQNPGATVHFVTGAAGMSDGTESLPKNPAAWSAVRCNKYSYTRLKVVNFTHVHVEQVAACKQDRILDSVWITKNDLRPQ